MMLYIACMHEIELPDICQEEQHVWANMSAHGCGAGEGDQVFDEAIVIAIPAKATETGNTDLICSKCFQKSGKPQGVRDPNIVGAYRINRGWDLKSSPITVSET